MRVDGAVEGLGDVGMDDTATHLHVLRHRNVAVPEMLGADASRHTPSASMIVAKVGRKV